jgi:AmiR/NasT family two-component response regulator
VSALTRKRLPSFRGLRALIEHPPGRDRDVLVTQLELLGLRAMAVEIAPSPPWQDVDIFFFDADAGHGADLDEGLPTFELPTVALIGSETPGRLEAMLAREPSAYLLKPIRSTGVYSSLAIALHQFAAMHAIRRKLASVEDRLRMRRTLLSAVLRVMTQSQVGEAEAFRLLQRAAMAQRVTIEALSAQILSGERPVPRLQAG